MDFKIKIFFTLGADQRSIACLPCMTMPIWSWVQVLQQTKSIEISYSDTTKISKPDYLVKKDTLSGHKHKKKKLYLPASFAHLPSPDLSLQE